MLYKVQKLRDAYELQKGISRARQEEAGKERATTDPIIPQEKPDPQ